MAPKPTAQAIVEGFVLRARRVLAHSLIREQAELMTKLHKGAVTIAITVNTKTGEETHRKQAEYPPEEALESLASRVRPLILSSEPIYYENVLNALVELVGTERLNEEIDLDWWRDSWRAVIDANQDAQAYSVATHNGTTTDRKLMYAWLYGDVIHAQSRRSPVISGLSINERYYAAAPGIARICNQVGYMLMMLRQLIAKGVLTVDPKVQDTDVVVTNTIVDQPVQVFLAPLDAPIPDGITTLGAAAFEGTDWKSPHEELGEYVSDAAEGGSATG